MKNKKWHIEMYSKSSDGTNYFIYEEGAIVCEVNGDYKSEKEAKANAELIADAPVMFEYILRKAEEGDREARKIIEKHDKDFKEFRMYFERKIKQKNKTHEPHKRRMEN